MGPTCCVKGECKMKNEWYSQCLTRGHVFHVRNCTCSERYGQCGGKYRRGATCCKGGQCKDQNKWYSQCL